MVAPEEWGSGLAAALIDEAKRIAPDGLDLHVNQDNARAIRFYEKHGFVVTGADVNPMSGASLHRMSWRARAHREDVKADHAPNCSLASRA